MKKKFLLLILSVLFILSSCTTTYRSYEERRADLVSLYSDMLSLSPYSVEVSEIDILLALTPSYKAYSEYVSLYDDISYRYASYLSSFLTSFLKEGRDIVNKGADIVIDRANASALEEGTGFSNELEGEIKGELTAFYYALLSGKEEELNEAFNESYSLFTSVSIAYKNLKRVGINVDIPFPESIPVYSLAKIMADTVLLNLKEDEILIKNAPAGE